MKITPVLKTTSLLLTTAALTLGLTACGNNENVAQNKTTTTQMDTLKFGVTNFADSLETTDNYFAWVVMRYGLGECLVRFDKQMNPTSWLAKDWKVSEDKKTWTFNIDPRAVFSNGDKVTPEIVKASLERTFDKSTKAKTFFTASKIIANKDNSISITTDKPSPIIPGMLADPLFIIINTNVTDRDYAKEGAICTGPYMVKSYSKEKAVMVKNPNYWNGEANFNTIEIPTIDDPNTRAMALQANEVDMIINVAPGDLPIFKENSKDFTVSEIASLRTVLAQMNQNKGKILADKKVRSALISCLDRKAYNQALLKGTFITGKAPVPPSLNYGFDQLKDENSYNVERAKKLLAEAGWKDTNNDGILDKDGKDLALDFVYYSGRAELPLYAEATQANAKDVGIKINLENVDYNVLDGMREKGDFDLIISNIITANTGDPEIYLNWYWKTNINGSNPQNGTGYSNFEFDQISDSLKSEFDPAKRREDIIKMQQIILDDSAAIFFGYPKTNMAFNNKVSGAEILPADYYWVTKNIKPAKQ